MLGEIADMEIEILASPKPPTVAVGSSGWLGLFFIGRWRLAALLQLFFYLSKLIVTLLRPVLGGTRASQEEETKDAGGNVHGRKLFWLRELSEVTSLPNVRDEPRATSGQAAFLPNEKASSSALGLCEIGAPVSALALASG